MVRIASYDDINGIILMELCLTQTLCLYSRLWGTAPGANPSFILYRSADAPGWAKTHE